MVVAVDTAVALPAAATAMTVTAVCPRVVVDTRPRIPLAIPTTDTAPLLVVVPSRLHQCGATPMATATDEALPPCVATILLAATATTFPLPRVAVPVWTTLPVTSPLAARPETTPHLAATATCRHPLRVVEGTMTSRLLLLAAQAGQAADTQTLHPARATTTLAPLPVATNVAAWA